MTGPGQANIGAARRAVGTAAEGGVEGTVGAEVALAQMLMLMLMLGRVSILERMLVSGDIYLRYVLYGCHGSGSCQRHETGRRGLGPLESGRSGRSEVASKQGVFCRARGVGDACGWQRQQQRTEAAEMQRSTPKGCSPDSQSRARNKSSRVGSMSSQVESSRAESRQAGRQTTSRTSKQASKQYFKKGVWRVEREGADMCFPYVVHKSCPVCAAGAG